MEGFFVDRAVVTAHSDACDEDSTVCGLCFAYGQCNCEKSGTKAGACSRFWDPSDREAAQRAGNVSLQAGAEEWTCTDAALKRTLYFAQTTRKCVRVLLQVPAVEPQLEDVAHHCRCFGSGTDF